MKVFCVEQNRWAGRNLKFRSGSALAHASLRRAAMSGSQGNVWAEVARKNIKHGTQSRTQTYRRTIQNRKLRAKIKPYRQKLAALIPKNKKLAGLIFASTEKFALQIYLVIRHSMANFKTNYYRPISSKLWVSNITKMRARSKRITRENGLKKHVMPKGSGAKLLGAHSPYKKKIKMP